MNIRLWEIQGHQASMLPGRTGVLTHTWVVVADSEEAARQQAVIDVQGLVITGITSHPADRLTRVR
jgi:hypothetical protein